MNSEQYHIVFAKERKCEWVIRCFPKKAKPAVGKVVVSPPRGPARLRPSHLSTLHISPLSLSLSFSHIPFIYFPNHIHATAPPIHQLDRRQSRSSGMKSASRNNTSAPIVITAALDLRRMPSVSTSVSSSSRRSSSEGSEFKKSDLVADGELTDNSKPLDRVYTPATMTRTSINMPHNELPALTVSSLPETSGLRDLTSPTPSGDSSPPPTQYTSPFTMLARPGDEDLFVKVSPLPETTDLKDQQSQFILPSPPLTRAGTKSSRKSISSRPGSGVREGQDMEGREEVDITDTGEWRDSHVDDPNPSLDPRGGLEGGRTAGSSRRIATTHPLKVNIPSNSQSPPLWEIIGPSEDNEMSHRTTNETFAARQYVPCLLPRDHISPEVQIFEEVDSQIFLLLRSPTP